MLLRLIAVVALAVAALATPASAAHRHHGHHHHHHRHHHHRAAPDANGNRAAPATVSFAAEPAIVRIARSTIGETATDLGVRSRLWCMAAVNKWLERAGLRGSGSDEAYSALRLGPHVSEPRVGALAVMPRRGGGHVGVVAGVTEGGDPIVISGNHGSRVGQSVYPRRRIRAYVVLSESN